MPSLARATTGTAIALALALACPGCAGFALPPSRTDVASTFVAGSGKVQSGLHFASGVHYASATLSHHVPLDVGAGYVFELMTPRPQRTVAARASAAVATPDTAARRAQGFYIGAATAIGGDRHQRSWAGGRAQLVFGPNGPRASLSARISWELFTTAQAAGGKSTPCGFSAGGISGTAAAGLFAESGVQVSGSAPTAFVTTVGLSFRLPLIAAIAVDACHCGW